MTLGFTVGFFGRPRPVTRRSRSFDTRRSNTKNKMQDCIHSLTERISECEKKLQQVNTHALTPPAPPPPPPPPLLPPVQRVCSTNAFLEELKETIRKREK